MHMNKGVYFTLSDQKIFLFDKYRDIYLKNIQYFKGMCETLIDGDNINIAIENSEKYLRILDFRHFERLFQFSQSDRKGKKKAISDGMNVSVVLDMVSGNTSE
ncbi:hypothetical protein [Clostridium oryzae]|uniref:Uncharacterized protein n=1 Tax=Clostridium oryzae TaxID=1450648 RepID=A0A1V4IYR8_9CLOT|nr:hypothetical protein [Clostridium oryzae]OPJ65208.1 hypothetical protein CLORY_02080 [Clostridium oryzae]